MAECKPTCEVNPCDSYELTQELRCAWEKYFEPEVQRITNESKKDNPLIDALLEGFFIYDCDDDSKVYNCKDVILYPKDNKFYKSKVDNNTRNPQDSNSWFRQGNLQDIFSKLEDLSERSNISIDYHASCSGDNCTALYNKGQCVAIKVDTGEVDSCNKPIFEDVYYISLEDKNIDIPSTDSETWDGPHSACDLIKGSAITGSNLCAVNQDYIYNGLIVGQ